jgi:hypothetical protein
MRSEARYRSIIPRIFKQEIIYAYEIFSLLFFLSFKYSALKTAIMNTNINSEIQNKATRSGHGFAVRASCRLSATRKNALMTK